jgi:hypothetical protein
MRRWDYAHRIASRFFERLDHLVNAVWAIGGWLVGYNVCACVYISYPVWQWESRTKLTQVRDAS